MNQEEETRQIELEKEINKTFQKLYDDLNASDRIEAEEALGHLSVAKAIWEQDAGSFSE